VSRPLSLTFRLKVAFYSVKASRNQSARWGWWARQDRARSVGQWLERLADREVKRREQERGVYHNPPASRLL
jgi:hypothetical protein